MFFQQTQVLGRSITEGVVSTVAALIGMIPEGLYLLTSVALAVSVIRLAQKKTLVHELGVIETLARVDVLCVDKTGTITMNRMTVQKTWISEGTEHDLIETMGLGCETDTYDPMEKAMLDYCERHGIGREDLFGNELVHEYAFTNELKMMGHIWRKDDELILAAKGSPERIFTLCDLTDEKRRAAEEQLNLFSSEGLRVIAVATAHFADTAEIPPTLPEARLTLLGLVSLSDPPRESVKADIAVCNRAGIRVVMVTGDNGMTASAIAKKVGIPGSEHIITGDMLEVMTDDDLREAVNDVSIFSRVIPEHKMRIVKAFRENGEIVAMTGDGVNDAPALKYADIGIAMGKRGSEVSREAADLILMDDNFTTIVETVKDGRRIYDNIRKAMGYVFTIHIPIAFASLLAPFLGIAPAALLLLPLHVVLLEILIDPTCSIVLERQPAEADIMDRRPRDPKEQLVTWKLLGKSILQGIVVFAASFGAYFVTLANDTANAPVARAMGLSVIMLANLFLVQVNSSDRDSALHMILYFAKDKIMWAINLGTLALIAVILYTPLSGYLKLAALSGRQMLIALGLAAGSVLWYELVKLVRKISADREKDAIQ
jgi:Ca2+-transporting ATPase